MRIPDYKHFACVALLAAVLPCHPQEVANGTSQVFPADVHIYGVLKTDLSSRNSKVGDPVELDVVRSVGVFDGHKMQLLVPERARLLGTITMVKKAAKDQPAALAIQITEAKSKSGTGRLNGILGKSVLAAHSLSWFGENAGGTQGNRTQSGAGCFLSTAPPWFPTSNSAALFRESMISCS